MNSPDAVPQVDFTDAVDRQFAFIRRVVELNHQYARSLAEATNTLTGVTRSQFESVGSAMREQAQAVSGAAQRGLESVGQAAREQAEQAELVEREVREEREQAERQKARDAAKAERQQRKEAHDKARERYESLNKTELSDELAKRDLPKTGNVDELIERLVADDTK